MAPTYQLCGSVGGGFKKVKMASAPFSIWEKAIPNPLPWCQTLQFFPVHHWCLSSCYCCPGAQREWVWVNLRVGFSRGMVWDSTSFFHQLSPYWFLQLEFMGTYLPGTGTQSWGAWYEAGNPCSCDIPPEFLSTTHWCDTSLFHVSTPVWIEVVSLIL